MYIRAITIFLILVAIAVFVPVQGQQPQTGVKTNNNAAPGATNIGVLNCLANAAIQTWTEGNQTTLSCDLSGNVRIIPGATAVTGNSALGCYIISAASTNSNLCKNAAGNIYGFRIVNTTATLYYLRLYNSSSAPTCSSATGFIESIPIPASATGAGFVEQSDIPIGYTTGIGYCLTGGSSSTDNTNAAVGIFGAIKYK